jgi:hypothetical protein
VLTRPPTRSSRSAPCVQPGPLWSPAAEEHAAALEPNEPVSSTTVHTLRTYIFPYIRIRQAAVLCCVPERGLLGRRLPSVPCDEWPKCCCGGLIMDLRVPNAIVTVLVPAVPCVALSAGFVSCPRPSPAQTPAFRLGHRPRRSIPRFQEPAAAARSGSP